MGNRDTPFRCEGVISNIFIRPGIQIIVDPVITLPVPVRASDNPAAMGAVPGTSAVTTSLRGGLGPFSFGLDARTGDFYGWVKECDG